MAACWVTLAEPLVSNHRTVLALTYLVTEQITVPLEPQFTFL